MFVSYISRGRNEIEESSSGAFFDSLDQILGEVSDMYVLLQIFSFCLFLRLLCVRYSFFSALSPDPNPQLKMRRLYNCSKRMRSS